MKGEWCCGRSLLWWSLATLKHFLIAAPSIMSTSNAQQAFCLPSPQCVVCIKVLPLICGYSSLYWEKQTKPTILATCQFYLFCWQEDLRDLLGVCLGFFVLFVHFINVYHPKPKQYMLYWNSSWLWMQQAEFQDGLATEIFSCVFQIKVRNLCYILHLFLLILWWREAYTSPRKLK